MANEEHLRILKKGVGAWNQWHWKHPETEPNLDSANLQDANLVWAILRHARLSSAKLEGANLRSADLRYAQLNNAKLTRANLPRANLVGANMKLADLSKAFLRGADMRGLDLRSTFLDGANLMNARLEGALLGSYSTDMDLRRANLSGVIFEGVNFRGTNFAGATMRGTTFSNCDLSETKGLDNISHGGPSTVGIDTIFRSRGNISKNFLRECGVPESFLEQIQLLSGAQEYYSCFISYSGSDEDFARRLHNRMREAHLRVWFAPEDIQGGRKLHEQIDTAILIYEKLLIVLSEASLKSEWVMTELRKARLAERQTGKRKLFPVRLVDFETLRNWSCFDSDSGKDLAVEVREYAIPDFSNWKDHDQFEIAFSRLLNDLRTEKRAK
jgi:uncharacterized protein YjbI with pentapeptide repeats